MDPVASRGVLADRPASVCAHRRCPALAIAGFSCSAAWSSASGSSAAASSCPKIPPSGVRSCGRADLGSGPEWPRAAPLAVGAGTAVRRADCARVTRERMRRPSRSPSLGRRRASVARVPRGPSVPHPLHGRLLDRGAGRSPPDRRRRPPDAQAGRVAVAASPRVSRWSPSSVRRSIPRRRWSSRRSGTAERAGASRSPTACSGPLSGENDHGQHGLARPLHAGDCRRAGFHLRDFLHEGNGDIWLARSKARGRSPAGFSSRKKPEGGDMLAKLARENPPFLDGFSRVVRGRWPRALPASEPDVERREIAEPAEIDLRPSGEVRLASRCPRSPD